MEPRQQGDGRVDGHLANLEYIVPLLLGGEAGRQKHLEATEAGPPRTEPAELQEAVELHVCMGVNLTRS
ncbi:hypothetical protein [Kitasatospora sp. NPDC058190]|uniref:hypothetical protein n=1 Tax=Kitasatospora sp. NPDC058190 TaxID=3346371 RepID=UPI0036D837EF